MEVFGTGSAQALVVNVSGKDWNVSTFPGSYYVNYSKFETIANGGVMPWWGNQSMAVAFTAAVDTALGLPWKTIVGDMGPLFAFSFNPGLRLEGITVTPPSISLAYLNPPLSNGVSCPDYPVCVIGSNAAVHEDGVWAQATPVSLPPAPAPVPGPLTILGITAAFGFSRKLRNRIKGTTNADSSTYIL